MIAKTIRKNEERWVKKEGFTPHSMAGNIEAALRHPPSLASLSPSLPTFRLIVQSHYRVSEFLTRLQRVTFLAGELKED